MPLKEIRAGNEIQITTGEAISQQKQFDLMVTLVDPETGLVQGAITTYSGKAQKARYYDFELRGCFDVHYQHGSGEGPGGVGGPVIVDRPGELSNGTFVFGRLTGEMDDEGARLMRGLLMNRISGIYVIEDSALGE